MEQRWCVERGCRRQNLLSWGLRWWGRAEAVGAFPARGRGAGQGGLLSPCVGLGRDGTKDNVRGRHGWRMEALLGLKRGLYSTLFAR